MTNHTERILKRRAEVAHSRLQKLLAATLADVPTSATHGPWGAAEEAHGGAMDHAHRRVMTTTGMIVPGVLIECVPHVSDTHADNVQLMLAAPTLLQDALRLSRLTLALTEQMSLTQRSVILEALIVEARRVSDHYAEFLAE